ncbi:MAG TPA: glycoside hydrolase family 30 beta sandwich domain-containing protein [Polyangiaceae bacterium]
MALASAMVAAAFTTGSCTDESPGGSGGSGSGSGGTSSGAPSSGTGGAGAAQGGTSAAGLAGGGAGGTGGSAGGGAGGSAGSAQAGATGGTVGGSSGGSGGTGGGGAGAGAGTGGAGSGNAAGSSAAGGSSPGGSGNTTDPTVRLDQTKQTIDGFGINDTWRALTDSQARALFDPVEGIGLTILRVGMSPNGNFYNNNEANSITAAKNHGATTIIGSVWSPPANCKDNNNTQKGGHLLTSCYESWSDSIANFAEENDLYAMSAGNEPDFASCAGSIGPPCTVEYDTTLYTAKEMVAFVKVLGPKLDAVGVKLIAPEASEWVHIWSNTSATGSTVASHPNSSDPLKCGCFGTSTDCAATCTQGNGYDYGHWLYNDPAAWTAVDILGVHQYDTQVAEPWPADVPDRKPVWQTEMSGVKYWPEGEPSKDIDNGIAVAGWLHNALTVGEANAWLWWWYQGQDTNEGLYLADGSDTKRHYTFGNYTKFIRPGYVRVDVTGTIPEGVSISAYKGADGTVVVVAINGGTAEAVVPLAISGGTAPAAMTPHVTSASEDLKAGTAVTVTGGILMASLPSKTVTTFVGQ